MRSGLIKRQSLKRYLRVVDFLEGYLPYPAVYFDSEEEELLKSKTHLSLSKQMLSADCFRHELLRDFSEFLQNDILVKVDHASMFNSWVRAPFLDTS